MAPRRTPGPSILNFKRDFVRFAMLTADHRRDAPIALQGIADEAANTKEEPARLNLTQPGEYGLFTILREFSSNKDETYLSNSARRMIAHLRGNQLLLPGWSNSKGGRMRVEQSLLAESWNPTYADLGFNPDDADPPFLQPAGKRLSKADAAN